MNSVYISGLSSTPEDPNLKKEPYENPSPSRICVFSRAVVHLR